VYDPVGNQSKSIFLFHSHVPFVWRFVSVRTIPHHPSVIVIVHHVLFIGPVHAKSYFVSVFPSNLDACGSEKITGVTATSFVSTLKLNSFQLIVTDPVLVSFGFGPETTCK